MNDVERLAEALRRANAELEVDSGELADAVEHAHRRLIRRLLAVAALSAIGAMLLLSGGLAASSAVKTNRQDSADDDKAQSNDHKQKHHDDDKNSNGNGSGDGNHGDSGNGDNQRQKKKGKEKTQSNVSTGHPTKPKKVAGQPNLKVISLTKTSLTVVNDGTGRAERFEVLVEAEGPNGETIEEPVQFEALAAEETLSENFTKELPCESGLIIAKIDPEDAVKESEENDNAGSEKCEPATSNEEKNDKNQGEIGSTNSTASSENAAPSSQEPREQSLTQDSKYKASSSKQRP